MGKIVKNGITYGGKSTSAGNISYDNTTSELQSQTVQNAITELKDLVDENTGDGVGRFEKDDQGNITGEIFNIYEGNYKNIASGEHSHAEGFNTTASGTNSHAEGYQTIASGFRSHAEGSNTEASGQDSHAGGTNTVANLPHETVIGKYNFFPEISCDNPPPPYLFIIGNGEDPSNRSNIVEVTEDVFNVNGDITAAGNTLIMQCETLPPASQAVSNRIIQYIGRTYEDDTPYIHGCFYECISNEGNPPTYSWKEIDYEKVGHLDELSLGGEIFNIYEGDFKNTASGDYSHAEGYNTTASGNYSHVEGEDTIASGYHSHAEGYNTIASQHQAHAEGSNTEASGTDSHAEGYSTTASGSYSHAEGYETTASGDCSHAEGSYTTASGNNSHVEGYATIATANYQTVIGKYNIADIVGGGDSNSSDSDSDSDSSDSDSSDSDPPTPSSSQHLFIIGNGTDGSHRSNIVEVTSDTFNVNGDITVAGKPLVVQCDTMSTADEYLLGRIVQYVGATDAKYTHGCFYECVSDGEEPPTYSWQITKVIKFDNTPTSGSANAVKSDGIYKNTAGKKYYSNNTLKGEIFNDYTNNKATGNYSHAEGYYTQATGSYSHAEGYSTQATGSYSHAEGRGSAASGESSHAEGYFATATGNYSHAVGEYIIASQRNMTAIGKYNSPRTGDLFNIGNGSSTTRSNIVEVNTNELNVNGDISRNSVPMYPLVYNPQTESFSFVGLV